MKTEKKKIVARTVAGLLLCGVVLTNPEAAQIRAKKKTAASKSVSKTIKVGQRFRIKKGITGASFKSSNSVVASVDEKGVVTGKKKGRVKISVIRQGKKTKKYTVAVKKRARKPESLPVTFSEIALEKAEEGSAEGFPWQMDISNHAKKGTVKRIIYSYSVPVKIPMEVNPSEPANPSQQPGTAASGQAVSPGAADAGNAEQQYETVNREVTLTARDIKAGETAGAVCSGAEDGAIYPGFSQAKLTEIKLYTGKALYIYDATEGSYQFKWGTKDKKAPVITGYVRKKSALGYNDILRVYYSDRKKQYNFTRFVKAEDDRDGRVKVKADTSKINWKKSGVYKLWFSASDRAGNKSRTWARVRVYVPGTAESAADSILRSITRKNWSDEQKARAIYRYIRGHCSYISHTAHGHWRTSALHGLRYHSGDCYIFYAMSRLLLTRAGIPNIIVKRYPVPGGMTHYWNLTYVRGGWYHFDTTPRSRNANFCLWTDAQLWSYSTGYVFQFKRNIFPKRASKRL